MEELFWIALGFLAIVVALLAPIVSLVLVIVLYGKVGKLRQRLEQLETLAESSARFREEQTIRPAAAVPVEVPEAVFAAEVVEGTSAASPFSGAAAVPPARREPIQWEMLIGRRALGWVAVVLLLFATAFFLRYAYENGWIGPHGRVAVGLVAGLALIVAGYRYARIDWRIFSQMLTAAGVLVLYLAVYSAFGFYRLLPQQVAGAFLLVVVVEAALLAVLYNAAGLAWVSLLGGLATPLLMSSEVDPYPAFFTYLAALNLGGIVLGRWRKWTGLSLAALLGTQGLFWIWYSQSYHPEKLAWALGFQLAVYGLSLLYSLVAHLGPGRRAGWDELARMLTSAYLWFTAAYVLLRPDYRPWLGLLAVAMAGVYVLLARLVLMRRPVDERQLLAALAVAVGFVALAFPIQAEAQWVALGWAAEAAALAWFGLRIQSPTLRALATVLMVMAGWRLLAIDTPIRDWEPLWPVWNDYAVPALGVCGCWLGSLAAARRYLSRLDLPERILAGAATIAGLLLLWFVLSVDLLDHFRVRAIYDAAESVRWRWLGQLSLSALWAVYAAVLLSVGFVRRLAILRWSALLIFALTTGKVLLVDMSGLQEVYRIAAFFVVAVVLGIAGWAYQRLGVDKQGSEENRT